MVPVMLSKEKTVFFIICCCLGILIPLLWSRSSDFKINLPRLYPLNSKWVTEHKEVSSTNSPNNIYAQKKRVVVNSSTSQDVNNTKGRETVVNSPRSQDVNTKEKEVESSDPPKYVLENKMVAKSNPPQLWTKHVHLCIMFNLNNMKPNPQTINLLLEYYHPFFDHITLIFDGKWNKRPEYLPEYVNFIGCESNVGWYQHKCLNMCLSQPTGDEVKGFFYIADDMFINLNNLASYNLAQTWCMPTAVYDYNQLLTMDKNEAHKIWYWWGPPLFFENALKVVVDSLPEEWIRQLQSNVGFPDHYSGKGIFDIIYLPKSLVSKMTKVITHILSSKELFCELAGPLAVGIVVPRDEKTIFSNSFLWGYQRNIGMIRKFARTCDIVHPLKLSQNDQAAVWKELMDQQLKIATPIAIGRN